MTDKENNQSFCEKDILTICNTLLTLETVALNVGIPIVPLSSARAKLKQNYYSPQDDFVKSSLVTVPTANLHKFLETLNSQDSKDTNELDQINLQLEPSSNFDYFFLPLVVGAVIFSFVSSLILSQNTPSFKSLISAGFSAMGASASSLITVTNKYRLMTFKNIIETEISRREGNIGTFNTGKIPLVSINPVLD